jgi:hypothetical protein
LKFAYLYFWCHAHPIKRWQNNTYSFNQHSYLYYKNNIYLYNMLCVLTPKSLHQVQANKKEGCRRSWIVIHMKGISLLQLYVLHLCCCIKIKLTDLTCVV